MTPSEKQSAWQRIQAEAPDHADLLKAITRYFGPPKRVEVSLDGERVI